MSKLPILTGKQLIAALSKAGFEVIRIKGSHHFLRHEDGRSTVVTVHTGEAIGPGLLTKILRDCDLTRERLQELF
ncbi:MAG: type II toxin-antitoxin system HicA family toxin [Pseudomonadota bacterium]|nr:type II toxin-antitoxin system HicA family toxin [Pseudomonadota bacterium]